MRVVCGDVRGIGDNRVETLARHRVVPARLDEARIRDTEVLRIGSRDRYRGGRYVDANHRGAGPLVGNGEGDCAAAGAQIENARRRIGGYARQGELDQKLRFRTRYQDGAIDLQLEAVKLAPSGEIGNGLAVAPPARETFEFPQLRHIDGSIAVRCDPCAILRQHVSQQDARIERNETASAERLRDSYGGLHVYLVHRLRRIEGMRIM